MALVINTNVASLNTQRQLLQSGNALDQATERLSSGNRINSAKDDAAGLAIANRMTSQIRGLDQAVRNANDGVSMIQTAEGALQEVTNILQRMRELSVQSANGIYSDDDRARLDSEAQQLKEEVSRIAAETTFNGQALLDGSLQDTALQVGSEQNQTIEISVGSFSTSSLGGTSGDIVGEAATNGLADLTALDTAGDISINDTDISALDTATTLNEALATINADLDGKGAEASAIVNVEGSSVGSGVLVTGTDQLTLTVTDGNGETQVTQVSGTKSLDELVAKINDETSLEARINDAGRIELSGAGATSVTVAGSGDALTNSGLDAATTNFSMVFNDTSADKSGVKIEMGTATAAELQALGIDAHDDDGNLQGAATTASTDLEEGDLIINGIEIGAIDDQDGTPTISTQAAEVIKVINESSDLTGVVAFAGDTTGAIALRSTDGGEISIKAGDSSTAASVLAATGLQERNAAGSSGSVASIDISTAAGAQKAIGILDEAISQVSETRADLGAVNNRLDFTVSNLTNVSEKTSAAKSRIMDADFAQETAALSKSQVLQQAATAMLAQANARPQQVLSLLQ
ncbi:flagellar biosynthesis protein FliC [Gilvimarinus agarilyticus]|uniref:flagellin N-terminal helical domain-containing protein n=1 Tax=Gilvimarinus sp. 2_MG-2023 TaxID=3062666 RepID=UPI001C08649C|nr:flagellin [Gilvimarinus sp. 2_MG-2023]MBU2887248.1 flagellar biosynthesis protein FliC [Gilvimarinus agarilyticus]MDO6571907.1 flagellin [Gilvimarinus sp. 2_MG-2023]